MSADTLRGNREAATFRLMQKFHRATECGRPEHWAECEALADAYGWESWEDWLRFNAEFMAAHRDV